jgi:hypothetical protein
MQTAFFNSNSLCSIYEDKVQAGFPSPAEGYIEQKLDLNKYSFGR